EYAVSAPDRGSFPAVQAGAVPAVTALKVADPGFASGPPSDQPAEAAAVLDGLAGWRRRRLARDRHGLDAQVMQVTLDGDLAVAAVGGDRAGHAARAPGDPLDGGHELRAVRGGAVLHGVVHDDAVVVV